LSASSRYRLRICSGVALGLTPSILYGSHPLISPYPDIQPPRRQPGLARSAAIARPTVCVATAITRAIVPWTRMRRGTRVGGAGSDARARVGTVDAGQAAIRPAAVNVAPLTPAQDLATTGIAARARDGALVGAAQHLATAGIVARARDVAFLRIAAVDPSCAATITALNDAIQTTRAEHGPDALTRLQAVDHTDAVLIEARITYIGALGHHAPAGRAHATHRRAIAISGTGVIIRARGDGTAGARQHNHSHRSGDEHTSHCGHPSVSVMPMPPFSGMGATMTLVSAIAGILACL
jgi:hypothetical protein